MLSTNFLFCNKIHSQTKQIIKRIENDEIAYHSTDFFLVENTQQKSKAKHIASWFVLKIFA